MHRLVVGSVLVGFLAIAAACAAPAPLPSPSVPAAIVCRDLSATQCEAAVTAALSFIGADRITSLVVVEGYQVCPPWMRCMLAPTPSGGWPLSAMVAIRFSDGTNPVMVKVTDVAAASPEVALEGSDPAILLGP